MNGIVNAPYRPSGDKSDLAVLVFLIIAFLLAMLAYTVGHWLKKSLQDTDTDNVSADAFSEVWSNWQLSHPTSTPTLQDTCAMMSTAKDMEINAEKERFIAVYQILYNSDRKTAEHAYKNTPDAVRKAILKQYAPEGGE